MSRASLAPAAVLRAAAWPIEKLSGFGDAHLAEQAAAADPADQAGWRCYERAYGRAVAAERASLWSTTVDDRHFLKALTLANPAFAMRARQLKGRHSPARRIRRLEHTLYRYLARAVGRTEPCDLWAGVALISWSPVTIVERRAASYRFCPDLRPFQDILRTLGARESYRRSSAWRVNATLLLDLEGRWLYWARMRDGRLAARCTEPNELANTLLPLLPNEPMTLPQIVEHLHALTGVPLSRLRVAVDSYVDAGLIVGGLDLPARFSTPWEALQRAGVQLSDPDRQCWDEAVGLLQRTCRRLEERLDALSVDEVACSLDSAAKAVARLTRELGVKSDLPRVVLRCDLGLPYRVELGAALRAELARALEEYDRSSDDIFPTRTVRAVEAVRLARLLGGGRPLADLARSAAHRADAQTSDPVPGTARPPGAAGDPPRAHEVAAPLGCFMVRLLGSTQRSANVVVRGLFDEVAPIYARYAPLWGPVDPEPRDSLFRWLRTTLDDLAVASSVAVAELAGPCEANPNALAGPRLSSRLIELWGTTEGGPGLAGAELFADAVTGRPFARIPPGDGRAALFSFVAADIARGDPISGLLLRTSFRDGPAATFEASGVVSASEIAVARPSPPVRLPSGSVVKQRRTVLAGEVLAPLTACAHAARYAHWQRLARRYHWPPLVALRSDGGPALLVPTASPLALEAALDHGGGPAATLIVEEPTGAPWLVDSEERHFTAELALPFVRSRHAWS